MFGRILLAASAFALAAAFSVQAQQADVIHYWTSGGESRSIAVIAREYEKRGGKWVDDPAVGPQAEITMAMSRIAGGHPPTAMYWQTGAPTRELAQQGVLTDLDWLAAAGDWKKNLPAVLLDKVTVDGHVYSTPIDINSANWMFYSIKVFQQAGLRPPKTWDEFFAEAPKLQAAGYIPFAFGATAPEESWLFMALLAGVGGPDLYHAVTIDHDPKAASSAGVVATFEVMRRLRQYVDAGSPNRKWNDTLALVEINKAAFMILGDWAKGDFAAANLTLDKDYGCMLAPGHTDTTDALVMGVDALVYPKTDKPDQIQAQHKLAEIIMDPVVQTEFALNKGSIPSMLTADISSLDRCAKIGRNVMAEGPSHQLLNTSLVFTPDIYGQYTDLLGQYWANPEMTAVDATKKFAAIIAAMGP